MATDWTPWNMMEIPTTPGTSTVANDVARRPPLPTDWPILREHVEEDEDQQERLDDGPHDELDHVLAQHGEVPQQQGVRGPCGWPPRSSAAASATMAAWRRAGDPWSGRWRSDVVVISRAGPFRSG